jgi:hypothetical protein
VLQSLAGAVSGERYLKYRSRPFGGPALET